MNIWSNVSEQEHGHVHIVFVYKPHMHNLWMETVGSCFMGLSVVINEFLKPISAIITIITFVGAHHHRQTPPNISPVWLVWVQRVTVHPLKQTNHITEWPFPKWKFPKIKENWGKWLGQSVTFAFSIWVIHLKLSHKRRKLFVAVGHAAIKRFQRIMKPYVSEPLGWRVWGGLHDCAKNTKIKHDA